MNEKNEKQNISPARGHDDCRYLLHPRPDRGHFSYFLGLLHRAALILPKISLWLGLTAITFLSLPLLTHAAVIYERHGTTIWTFDTGGSGSSYPYGFLPNSPLIDLSPLGATVDITGLFASSSDTGTANNNAPGMNDWYAEIIDANTGLEAATSTNYQHIDGAASYLFWNFATTSVSSRFYVTLYNPNGYQAQTHWAIADFQVYGALGSALLNPSGNYVHLDLPFAAQTLADFGNWTISAKTTEPDSILRVIYYDDYGGYYTDVVNPLFSTSSLFQANYPKQNPLHSGHWLASAQLLSSSTSVLSISDWTSFYITTSTPIATSTPGEIFVLQDCGSASVLDGTFVSSTLCSANNFFKGIVNNIYTAGGIVGSNVKTLVSNIFPINMFTSINADFEAAKSSTSSPNITINSTDPHNFFYNANFVVLSSSSVGKIYQGSGFDYRTFLTYLMYAFLGLIMIRLGFGTVKILNGKNA